MSITQVAKIANVPYATAWRIINKQPGGSDAAIQAVRAAMERVGYVAGQARRGRPRRSAEGIRTHNVALLHMRQGTSISTSILSGVQEFLAARNLNLVFAQLDGTEGLPQAVKSGNVDGILGYGEFPDALVTPALRRVPAVWLMSRFDDTPDPWGDRVKPDHPAIGRLAARHLLGRGHDHVAFFNPLPGTAIYDERGDWFRREVERKPASLTFVSGPTARPVSDWMDRAAESLVASWLKLSPRPTGVFCPVDRLTLRIYTHLMRAGVQPGRDVEFVSCDNETELLSLIDRPPASIDLNRKDIARLAVERLLWRMRHGVGSPSIGVTVSPTLALGPADAVA